MSMNKTWPISNFKSDADSVGMEQLLLPYVTFYHLTSRNRGVDLITDVLPLGRRGMATQMQSANAIGYALARLIRGGLW
jgi:hypothetical protein